MEFINPKGRDEFDRAGGSDQEGANASPSPDDDWVWLTSYSRIPVSTGPAFSILLKCSFYGTKNNELKNCNAFLPLMEIYHICKNCNDTDLASATATSISTYMNCTPV